MQPKCNTNAAQMQHKDTSERRTTILLNQLPKTTLKPNDLKKENQNHPKQMAGETSPESTYLPTDATEFASRIFHSAYMVSRAYFTFTALPSFFVLITLARLPERHTPTNSHRLD